MEPVKDSERVQKMFAIGEPTMIDPESGYKYSLIAYCPKDNHLATLTQIERKANCLNSVTFECPTCRQQFAPRKSDLYVW